MTVTLVQRIDTSLSRLHSGAPEVFLYADYCWKWVLCLGSTRSGRLGNVKCMRWAFKYIFRYIWRLDCMVFDRVGSSLYAL